MPKPRVIVTCYPQSGHLHPLIPTARALADAGCPVLVATAAAEHAALAAAGLAAVDVGPGHAEASARVGEIMPEILAAPPPARRAIGFSFLFGHVYASAVADGLLERARSWRADVVLASVESLAGPLVAAQLGLPLVVSGFGTGLGTDVCAAATRAVAPLWARAGLDVGEFAGVFDGLFVDPCPPSLRPRDVPNPRRSQSVQPARFDGVGELPSLPARRPLIYVTFGTNPLFATPERFRTIARAIAAAGAAAVLTGIDPGALGNLPDGIVAHRFVPQSALLPYCDAVICHAGASTLLGALANGLPLLAMPLGADHFANAAVAVRRGVAVAVADGIDEPSLVAALARVLGDNAIRGAAAEVGAEIAAMPTPAAAADGILSWLGERLASRPS